MVTFEPPARTGRVALPGVDMHDLDWPARAPGGVPVVPPPRGALSKVFPAEMARPLDDFVDDGGLAAGGAA